MQALYYMEFLMFQHTAARRRLGHRRDSAHTRDRFNTQPPEGGWNITKISVSRMRGFNTQPPEGGWDLFLIKPIHHLGFNTQPPEGGWDDGRNRKEIQNVSTHSRPKAAGASQGFALLKYVVSTHSRPKAAG